MPPSRSPGACSRTDPGSTLTRAAPHGHERVPAAHPRAEGDYPAALAVVLHIRRVGGTAERDVQETVGWLWVVWFTDHRPTRPQPWSDMASGPAIKGKCDQCCIASCVARLHAGDEFVGTSPTPHTFVPLVPRTVGALPSAISTATHSSQHESQPRGAA